MTLKCSDGARLVCDLIAMDNEVLISVQSSTNVPIVKRQKLPSEWLKANYLHGGDLLMVAARLNQLIKDHQVTEQDLKNEGSFKGEIFNDSGPAQFGGEDIDVDDESIKQVDDNSPLRDAAGHSFVIKKKPSERKRDDEDDIESSINESYEESFANSDTYSRDDAVVSSVNMGKKVIVKVVRTAANQLLKVSINYDKKRNAEEVLVSVTDNDDSQRVLCH